MREAAGLKVVLVCDWFLKYTAEQACALEDAGADVTLVCRTHPREFGGSGAERVALLAEAAAAGVRVRELAGRVRDPLLFPRIEQLRRELRALAPEIVHAHDNHDPRLLAIVHGLPRVVTVHDAVPHLGARPVAGARGLVRRRWLDGAARLIVHGRRLAELLAAESGKPVDAVPHGARVRASPLPIPDEPAVLFFGRLEPYKGLDVLLAAMKQVWRERPDVRLVIAGRGSAGVLPQANPMVEVRNGYVPERDLDAFFARASLVVLPYVEGSQSGVGLQALARGIPIVATAVGALPELVRDPGNLVPPGDTSALAQAVLGALEQTPEIRRRTLEWTRDRFSWEVATRATLDVYRAAAESER